jgi:hypothetical protein
MSEDLKTNAPEPPVTVTELAAAYPDQIAQINKAMTAEIADLSPTQFAGRFPALYERIGKALKPVYGTNLGEKGFPLALDDPFGRGVLRVYAQTAGGVNLQLPAVLPFKDPATKTALESYIVRAAGAGDQARADAARDALKKCK